MRCKYFFLSLSLIFVLILLIPIQILAADTNNLGCLYCHQGIEDFTDGPMMIVIKAKAQSFKDPGGCVVCHGGTPSATDKNIAHASAPAALTDNGGPSRFYPDPGSVWIANETCGQCHVGYPERLQKALMNTEAGKLQGNLWSWGLQKDHAVIWGNYDIKDADGHRPGIGTEAYKSYMVEFAKTHPGNIVFSKRNQ